MKISIIKRLKLIITKLQFWKNPYPTEKVDVLEEISKQEEKSKTDKTKLPKFDRLKQIEQHINTQLSKLHIEQAKLKAKQVMAQIRLKKLNLLKKHYQREIVNKLPQESKVNPNQKQRLAEHHRRQEEWIKFLIKQRPNLALTLNFNPSNYSNSDTFDIDMVKNKVNQWWKLYLQYHLGQKYQDRDDISYTCVIEHSNTNIHCHLAVKLNVAHITDEIVYDEEQLIQTLWKLVIPSGTVFVSSIWSTDWFWYMVKEFGFENKMFFSLK